MTLLSVAARINWVAKGNTCSSTIFFPCKHRKNWFELFRPFLKLTTLWLNCCFETDLNFKISELLKSLKWIFPSSVASTAQLHCLIFKKQSYQKSQQKYLKIQKIFFTYFSIIENCYFQYSKYFWNYLFWLWNNFWHFLTLWNPIW